jgi:hypothetical protein
MFNKIASVMISLVCCLAISGQIRKLHTRDMTRLSQVQVVDQLKRNDIIFIPVGAVETNGIMPSDRDYVSPLAYAMAMADETGGLYPGLVGTMVREFFEETRVPILYIDMDT